MIIHALIYNLNFLRSALHCNVPIISLLPRVFNSLDFNENDLKNKKISGNFLCSVVLQSKWYEITSFQNSYTCVPLRFFEDWSTDRHCHRFLLETSSVNATNVITWILLVRRLFVFVWIFYVGQFWFWFGIIIDVLQMKGAKIKIKTIDVCFHKKLAYISCLYVYNIKQR
jgi:hypothetical protein